MPDRASPLSHREIRIFLIAGCLLIALLLAVAYLWYWNNDASGPIDEKYYIKADKEEDWIKRFVGDPIALFTFILTCATFGLYLATRRLWDATERLIQSADATSQMQLRAYITLNGGNITAHRQEGDEYRITTHIEIFNSGQTPAYAVFSKGDGLIGPPNLLPFGPCPRDENSQSTILGSKETLNIDFPYFTVDYSVIKKIIEKDGCVYVWGQVEYNDIFHFPRYFNYRVRVYGNARILDDNRLCWALSPHPIGYDAN